MEIVGGFFSHESNDHWSSPQRTHRHHQQVTQSTKRRAQLSTRRTYLFPLRQHASLARIHGHLCHRHRGNALKQFYTWRKQKKKSPWLHRNTASLATRHCRICVYQNFYHDVTHQIPRFLLSTSPFVVQFFPMDGCKILQKPQAAAAEALRPLCIWMSQLSCSHRSVVLLKDVAVCLNMLRVQRKHKYVPSCNLLGELVIIEKLKPANCVCTKNQIAFVMQNYLSELVASL